MSNNKDDIISIYHDIPSIMRYIIILILILDISNGGIIYLLIYTIRYFIKKYIITQITLHTIIYFIIIKISGNMIVMDRA